MEGIFLVKLRKRPKSFFLSVLYGLRVWLKMMILEVGCLIIERHII
jgi:hypothetical protein